MFKGYPLTAFEFFYEVKKDIKEDGKHFKKSR